MQEGKAGGHDWSALVRAEEDGFDPATAHRYMSLVVRKFVLLMFSTLIRSR